MPLPLLLLLRDGVRALLLLAHLLCAALIACLYPALTHATQQRILKSWSRLLLKILRVRLHVVGEPVLARPGGHLVVANHLSWLDVFVINVHFPARFVAKSEVSAWPVLGWLVRRSGALFIRRGRARDTASVNRAITALLHQGACVAVFPQGTSSTGEQAVHFHSALLQSAIDAQATVQALAIYYHDAQGKRRDDAGFTGDMGLLQSLWKVLRGTGLQVTLTVLRPVEGGAETRRHLTQGLAQQINTRLAQLAWQPLICDHATGLAARPDRETGTAPDGVTPVP